MKGSVLPVLNSEKLGNLSAWGADLGRRLAETVGKNLGKQGSFHRSWRVGKHTVRADMDWELDEEDGEEE